MDEPSMRRLAGLRNYGLSIVFGLLLLAALTGQAFTGMAGVNERALDTGLPEVSIGAYLTSSEFAVDVAENWQSEYLQFFLYILLTVWLLQRGSPESKALDRAGRESDKDQLVGEYATADSPAWARASGWRRTLFSSSLGLVMGFFFLLSWTAQFIAGRSAYNAGQLVDLQAPVSWSDYLVAPDFWNRTLQNWQSELLAVGSMVVFSIYLRERGSPESKPVGTPHSATAVED
ncbi:MAG TPA: DUF6766 family protein [Dermatophilaceae bacterium]